MENKEDIFKNMETQKNYIEHTGKAVETDERFEHVMAITLDPRTDNKEGVIRCITSRSGNILDQHIDRSQIFKVVSTTLENFEITEKLEIKNEKEILNQLQKEGLDFLGLEDPDIWIDPETNLMHLYFTIPFISGTVNKGKIHLGHAVGKDLDSLEMTMPVLIDEIGRAKEVSIAPVNKKGFRYNLFESSSKDENNRYSTVRVATVEDMGKPWIFGDTIFHPKEHNIPWIAGHASPGPLFSKSFIDVGEGKLVGIMNGREANKIVNNEKIHGIFRVGLFIYDYEEGKIDWVSSEPFIEDSEAKIITFASQFVETGKGEGILYAHVDDSFVRAYTLNAEAIKSLLPK